jgi:hypothetical protein
MPPSSSVLSRSVPLAAAAVIGFTAGHFITPARDARFSASLPQTPHASAVVADSRPVAKPASAIAGQSDPTSSAEQRWVELSTAKRNQHVQRQLSAALEEIAKTAPEHAMELAAREPNLHSRELSRRAALRGWASRDPNAAMAAAMNLQPRRDRCGPGRLRRQHRSRRSARAPTHRRRRPGGDRLR